MIRRFVYALVAGLAFGVILGAQPAWAHDDIRSTAGDAAQLDDGAAYQDITAYWCRTPAGAASVDEVFVRNTYSGAADRDWRVEIWESEPSPQVKWTGNVRNIAYQGASTWDLPAGTIYEGWGSGLYAKITLLAEPGYAEHVWRYSTIHYPGHDPYDLSTRQLFPLNSWTC